jgi:hypothetical protein
MNWPHLWRFDSLNLSVCVPEFWNVDVGAIEVGDGRATQETQGAVEVGAEDFDGAIPAS